jgi:hypothetical protein
MIAMTIDVVQLGNLNDNLLYQKNSREAQGGSGNRESSTSPELVQLESDGTIYTNGRWWTGVDHDSGPVRHGPLSTYLTL